MISALLLLATAVPQSALNAGHHVPISVTTVHKSVATEACSNAYFSGEAPYIALDIESANDLAVLSLSVRGVNSPASSLSTPIGIVVRSQAAVDALVRGEPVTFSYLATDGKDSITISFPADPSLDCK